MGKILAGTWKPRYANERTRSTLVEGAMPQLHESCANLGPKTYWEPLMRELIPLLCSEDYLRRQRSLSGQWYRRSFKYSYKLTSRGFDVLAERTKVRVHVPPALLEVL